MLAATTKPARPASASTSTCQEFSARALENPASHGPSAREGAAPRVAAPSTIIRRLGEQLPPKSVLASMRSNQPMTPPRPSPRWLGASLRAGALAGVLGTLTLALGYYARFPGCPPLADSWSISLATIMTAGTVSGTSLGLGIGGGMIAARRRSQRWGPLAAGAAAGAILSGTVPSAIGTIGFGSLPSSYIGTDIAAAGVLVAIIVLGAMLSRPSTTGRESTIPAAPTLLCSALAATMVIVPFGLTIASIVAAVLPLDVIRELLYFVGGPHDESVPVLGIFSLLLAGVFGTLAGVFVALTDELAGILRDVWPSLREDR